MLHLRRYCLVQPVIWTLFCFLISMFFPAANFGAGKDGNSAKAVSIQGYLEGYFVYISSPFGGILEHLYIKKGVMVSPGEKLFSLDSTQEQAQEAKLSAYMEKVFYQLADMSQGLRPEEIQSREAIVKQRQAVRDLALIDLDRVERLRRDNAVSDRDYDYARLLKERDQGSFEEANADLATGFLGARSNAIFAMKEELGVLKADVRIVTWQLSLKNPTAITNAWVYDTLYREGEFVGSGQPVVVLLPPQNIKVRFYVNSALAKKLKMGDQIKFFLPPNAEKTFATIDYISNKAEYTPPVIYSRESNNRLVFLVEAAIDPKIAVNLHPGLPVQVELP